MSRPQIGTPPPSSRQFKHPSCLDIKPQLVSADSRTHRSPHIGSPIFITVLLLIALICSCGYSHFFSPFQAELTQFLRPLGNNDSIQNRPWNFLLLGSDNDAKYAFPNVLTQVVIVARVDPQANKVTMVSLPRDSWVWIPGANGMYKLDQAFYLGTQNGHPFEDGVRMIERTLETDYGIKIDRYGWIGLNGFSKLIDTVGGIDITVEHPILDDTYPNDTKQNTSHAEAHSYKRLYLSPGPQHLGGLEALEYVRSRHADLVGDLGRNQRQQQVLEALRAKLTLTSIINNYTELFKDMEGKVYTDLSTQEILDMATFARALDTDEVTRITLAPNQASPSYGITQSLYDTTTDTIQDVILPSCEAIEPLFNHIFALGAETRSCAVQSRNGIPNIFVTPEIVTPTPTTIPDTNVSPGYSLNSDASPTPTPSLMTPTPVITPGPSATPVNPGAAIPHTP
ncbi:hypothetical protein KSX_28630 [Ktedonospora formicarum]|uniref:Cell envelope-related transcriptional attenuator domain-containing protein n=2 Tax=Ktedonospora formicarum TaxID=2778364 RepID=A0A8J3I0S8_9CHLR|nr:hypothetical protein KSX_28630 [Ktedonospora formicarum]